jgi:hypothetical protein
VIKLRIDVHQEFYVVVLQEGGGNQKPAQRFKKEAFLSWAAKLKQDIRKTYSMQAYKIIMHGLWAARNLESVRGEDGLALIFVKSCHDRLLFPRS